MRLRIDGIRRSIRPQGVTLSDGTRITLDRTSRVLSVALRKGWGVRVIPQWWGTTGRWYLDYDFTPASRAFGIAGPLARESWLPALSDGSSVGAMPTAVSDRYKVLYEKFADSWRVRDATSLFDYEAGTSTATYTNPQWPGQGDSCKIPNVRPLVGVDEATATKACAGVIPSFQRACVADVMATGDRAFAAGYMQTQGPARYTEKEPEGKGSGAERGLKMR